MAKRILVTGKTSYIGTSFQKYLRQYKKLDKNMESYEIEGITLQNDDWEKMNFSCFDTILHAAGIAHADIGLNVLSPYKKNDRERSNLYYEVNTELTIEVAKKAKREGVKQFVFLSSILVYGESAALGCKKKITKDMMPKPTSWYGKSKLYAEKGLKKLEDENFKIAILRVPMVYGEGCKGNYPILAKAASKMLVIPYINNQRSMIYILNLCEIIRLIILKEKSGVYFPQNKEYVSTSNLIKTIAYVHNNPFKEINLDKFSKYTYFLLPKKVKVIVNKVFGSLAFQQDISQYNDMHYQIVSFKESIQRSEGYLKEKDNKKILILANHELVVYNFRLELIEKLLEQQYDIFISSPYGEKMKKLEKMGCHIIKTAINRHGKNVVEEIKLLSFYSKMIKALNPDMILTYTIKPNVYGSLLASRYKIPYIVNITGLGSALENKSRLQELLIIFYRIVLKNADCIFFQNSKNKNFFISHKIVKENFQLIPGSGVNTNQFLLLPYPLDRTVEFVFIARVMKEKGIEEYLKAAKIIKERNENVRFHICGFCEENYKGLLKQYMKDNIVIYHGEVEDVREILIKTHCTIHPSYHEGMSNVCLESASSGRPVITTNINGCRETIKENISGYLVKPKDIGDLVTKIEKFMALSWEQKKQMGQAGRLYIKEVFDRKIVVDAYMKQINKIKGKEERYVNLRKNKK